MTSGQPTPAETTRHKWLALGVLAAALSMIVLDGTIVGVAMPRIIRDLGLSLSDAQWVTSLYSMIFAALLLTMGALGDRLGRRRVFLAGVVVFVLGSLAAAVSSDAAGLIGSRALQGLGGSMLMPATLSSVNATFRGRDRNIAFGVWGAVMAGMAAIGPLLGGWLTTYIDWRWIFWVNLPIGGLVIVGALMWVPETRGDASGRFDVLGQLLSASALALLVFGLIEGATLGWTTPAADFSVGAFTWPATMPVSLAPVALLVGAFLLVGFVAWEQQRHNTDRTPLLDLRLFAIPTFTWGNITAMTVNAGEFALVFVLPLFLVNVLALDIMGAGLVLAAMAVGAFFSGAAARRLSERLGPPRVVLVGLALELIGVIATAATLAPAVSPYLVAATMAVYGLGLGLAAAQLTSTVLAGVPVAMSGVASATQSTLRQLGSALGAALAGTVLAIALTIRIPFRFQGTDTPDGIVDLIVERTIQSAGGTIPRYRAMGDEAGAAVPYLEKAFTDATAAVIWLAVGFLVLGLLGAVMVARKASVQEGDTVPDEARQDATGVPAA